MRTNSFLSFFLLCYVAFQVYAWGQLPAYKQSHCTSPRRIENLSRKQRFIIRVGASIGHFTFHDHECFTWIVRTLIKVISQPVWLSYYNNNPIESACIVFEVCAHCNVVLPYNLFSSGVSIRRLDTAKCVVDGVE